MRAVLAIAGLLAGCYSPNVTCEVQCGSDSPCPADLTCGADQYCHSSDDSSQTCTASLTVMINGGGQGAVTSSPDGIDCHNNSPNNCEDMDLRIGTVITLTAMHFGSSQFGGWNGDDCHGESQTCTFTIEMPETVSARFN
jgi:hypothetical protein